MKKVHSIGIKKWHGQHFLRDLRVTDTAINSVQFSSASSIFEIGPGDGFLSEAILQQRPARLWSVEIDHEWATFLQKKITDPRFTLFESDILSFDFSPLEQYKPWILLANLPYHLTFPILRLLKEKRNFFSEGVFMIQEEVAQKLVSNGGKTYGYVALFFQRYFTFNLLTKVPGSAFIPPPKVSSRLVHFVPKNPDIEIQNESEFWKFIKACFHQPRRTLKNNLQQYHYQLDRIDEKILLMRAQQFTEAQLIDLWHQLL